MMKSGMINRNTRTLGFSLVEVVMALSVGALIVGALVLSFRITLQNGSQNYASAEALQHARVAMNKIISDLRYTAKVKSLSILSSTTFEFYTRQLVDDDWDAEVIRYDYSANTLFRSVSGGPAIEIAGSPSENIAVTQFTVTLKKFNAGQNGFDPFVVGTDLFDKAVAATVTLAVRDRFNKVVSVSSIAHFKNN